MLPTSNDAFVADSTAGAEFGDLRLSRRLEIILRGAVSAPSASFPAVCASAAQLEGTYRFLNNPKVTAAAILEPHFIATAARVARCERVIVPHDSTQFAFGPVPRGDLDRVGRGTTYGFNAHVSMAVSGDGERTPLGVLAVSPYNRKFGVTRARPTDSKKNADNVMLRWSAHVKLVRERLGTAAKCVIHVMDREADDYLLLAELVAAGDRFVIRQAVDRRLQRNAAEPKVRSVVAAAPLVVKRTVNLSARRKPTKKKHATRHPLRCEREAVLEVRASRVSIPRTRSAGGSTPQTLGLNLVEVSERHPPQGETPVEWWLWTNEPIESAEEILAVVDAYRARWTIEEYFKALKTGCRMEERQLESKHALQNALALFVPVAWRLLLLRHIARVAPEASARLPLTELQLRGLRGYMEQKRKISLPEALSAREAMLAIAAIGGHIKNNGDPGWMVLGRGFDRLLDIELGMSLALNL